MKRTRPARLAARTECVTIRIVCPLRLMSENTRSSSSVALESSAPVGSSARIMAGSFAIARAIAKHPQIYLFDDSFSALDYKTDVALRRALKAQTDNATVIIVAQRISTVLHANQILVLDEGRIVGKGTHAQLMESCPEYQEIARSQLSQKELNLQKEGE